MLKTAGKTVLKELIVKNCRKKRNTEKQPTSTIVSSYSIKDKMPKFSLNYIK